MSEPTVLDFQSRIDQVSAGDNRLLASIRACFTRENHVDDRLCAEGECWSCGERDCPHALGEHYSHGGCPLCDTEVVPMEI